MGQNYSVVSLTFQKHLIPFPGTYYSKKQYNYGIWDMFLT